MKCKVVHCLAAVLSLVNYCQAISIVVGDHFLLPNRAGQIVQINVTGLSTDLVSDMDVNIQLGQSPAPGTPPSGPSPTIDYDNRAGHDLKNNIFSPVPHLFGDAGSTPYAITVLEIASSFTGPDSTVVANGGLITLIVDTTGFITGAWPLIMDAANFNGPTDFFLHGPIADVSITNGSIFMSSIPEPGSIVTASIALAALGAVAIRKRRAFRAKYPNFHGSARLRGED